VSTTDATDSASLYTLTDALVAAYELHDADVEKGSAWTYHCGTEGGNYSLTSLAAADSVSDAFSRLNDLKSKLNSHMADATPHVDADSPVEGQTDAAYSEEHIKQHTAIVTSDATTLATVLSLAGELLTSYAAHNTDSALAEDWVITKELLMTR